MSYIVKNCPAKVDLYCYANENRQKFIYCQDCTDCAIKQIVGKCKEHPDCACGNDILQLFQIEEWK